MQITVTEHEDGTAYTFHTPGRDPYDKAVAYLQDNYPGLFWRYCDSPDDVATFVQVQE